MGISYATTPRGSCSIGEIIVTLKQFLLITTVECIQMVVGYLDIFVFEEFCFAGTWLFTRNSACFRLIRS